MMVVIFGATGGIGGELLKLYKGESAVGLGRSDLDFSSKEFKNKFLTNKKYLRLIDNADVVINSSGVLGSDKENYEKIFDVNFNSNWLLLRHFMDRIPSREKKFVMIGSTSYSHGRDNYMLYAASKAALFNLYQSAEKFFKGSNLTVGLVNPRAVKTKMTAHLKGRFMSTEECARRIFDFIQGLKKSDSIDLI